MSAHTERPTRLAGGKTYCACGRPWPCDRATPAPDDRVASTLAGIRKTLPWLDRVRRQRHVMSETVVDLTLEEAVKGYSSLLAALEAVLKLHQPADRGTGAQCKGCATHVTFTWWPCPTYEAIGAALTGKEVGDG